jgi:hypothetical protein
MAQQTFLDKIREWIGGVAWAIFLWSARMTEDEYFAEQDRAAELLRAPVQSEQICPSCDGVGFIGQYNDPNSTCSACSGTGKSTRSDGG